MRVELIEKKKFAAAALNLKHEAFFVYVAAFSIDSGDKMYPSRSAQITYLKADEALTEVFSKYVDFADMSCQN